MRIGSKKNTHDRDLESIFFLLELKVFE